MPDQSKEPTLPGAIGEGAAAPSPRSSSLPSASGSRVDLHTHSTASDGLLSPATLVREAHRRGLGAIALTDHDTVAGLPEAVQEGAALGIEVVPGLELGSDVQRPDGRRREVHVLGYFVDATSTDLLDSLAVLVARRRDRTARMVARLNDLGIPLAVEDVFAQAGTGTVGRPHVARVLVALGAAADIADAFDRYLAAGRPAYVPRHAFTPEDAVGLVLAAGGVPVLAHPLTTGDPDGIVARLIPVGLAGVEVYYGEYDSATHAALRALADRHALIPTGGSDFHGEGVKSGRDLGGPPVPPETVERLRRAARAGPRA